MPIIMLSMSRWDGPFSSASLSLAKEFSKDNKVFYIDNPFTFKDFFSQYNSHHIEFRKKALLYGKNIYCQIDKSLENLIAVTPRLVPPINWIPQGKGYNLAAKLNNGTIIKVIKKILNDHNLQEYILFNSFNPFYGFDIPEEISPSLYVYQSRDDISESAYVKKHGVQMEACAIHRADIVLATSVGLVKKLSQYEKEIYHIPNAADISIFQKTFENLEKPEEIKGIDKKIIGYTGNICHRINFELLKEIALIHHDKILLLVGPVNNKQFYDIGLHMMENVICTGAKPIHELPAYLKHMDCTIIPFKCNELTKSIYPLKLNEYLAAGKPVVSTSFSEDIRGFQNVAYLADNKEAFLTHIDLAINENDKVKIEKRILEAKRNTWESRVNLFWKLIQENYG